MYANIKKHPEMETVIYDQKVIIGTCVCICKGGGGVCAYSGVEVDGYLSVAFRLHFGKFNAE